ncbi:hypothetical protein SK128_008287 [Halocaridina rubra]|uniref:Lipocalin/cytosolic fatty-acid binding domain-containing protein n=1 Tax=Halocaridina rubra TaxID=373956 RepID=A0AAN9A1J9_HALRR
MPKLLFIAPILVAVTGICIVRGVPQGQPNDLEELGILSFDTNPPISPQCPQKRTIPHFRTDSYMGRWYELERFESPLQRGDCATADFFLGINGTFNIETTEFRGGKPTRRVGLAVPASDTCDGRFIVTLPDIPEGDESPNYNVITTDYRNYAVVYTCTAIGASSKLEFAWIMARRPSLPEKFLVLLKNWLRNIDIDTSSFRKTNQASCPRFSPKRIS